ncbi:hypothetical protein CRI93_13400 [Longimonas halophila]|uniref:Acyloxyacyl hydrolase n=1 Tax=Longimonas halophila TaxID=1469170 RepID=A0A2H3NIX0_9BACT|nr:hypothetical protein [Longimonas halophila]PEN05203.1 hypothetical protein CRI93_13400 [Longimonas halophila]
MIIALLDVLHVSMSSCIKNAVFAISIIICMGGTGVASAQDSTSVSSQNNKDIRAWLSFEGGPTTPDEGATLLSLNYARSSHLFGLRFIGTSEGFFSDARYELAPLYGRMINWDWGHASGGTGVAVVWEREGSLSGSGPVNWTTVGVPVQATLYLTIPYRPIDWLGLKIGGHANVNPEDSFAGATVGLVIGKLR